jgi:LAO/AO transport system kinase
MIAINKADGDNAPRATRAAADYKNALHILTPASPNWQPPVLTISGLANLGLDELWSQITQHRERLTASGEFAARRQTQAVTWMHDMLSDRLLAMLKANPQVASTLPGLEAEVRAGRLLPTRAVDQMLGLLGLTDGKV